MGKDKAIVEIGGHRMADIVTSRLAKVLNRVVWVGRAQGFLWEAIADDPGLLGPAAGIATALRRLDSPVVVVAVDQPWIRSETIAELAKKEGTAIPRDDWLQVTCARYTPDHLEELVEVARTKATLQDVAAGWSIIERDEWEDWGEDGRSWYSVDTKEELDEGVARWGLPQVPGDPGVHGDAGGDPGVD